jgi:hypothetical protein
MYGMALIKYRAGAKVRPFSSLNIVSFESMKSGERTPFTLYEV